DVAPLRGVLGDVERIAIDGDRRGAGSAVLALVEQHPADDEDHRHRGRPGDDQLGPGASDSERKGAGFRGHEERSREAAGARRRGGGGGRRGGRWRGRGRQGRGAGRRGGGGGGGGAGAGGARGGRAAAGGAPPPPAGGGGAA